MGTGGASELMGWRLGLWNGDRFDGETPQMRPIWNPGEGGRARVKASIRYVTLFDNIFQGLFTKRPFERAVEGQDG
jgi:hypothetical protein